MGELKMFIRRPRML